MRSGPTPECQRMAQWALQGGGKALWSWSRVHGFLGESPRWKEGVAAVGTTACQTLARRTVPGGTAGADNTFGRLSPVPQISPGQPLW